MTVETMSATRPAAAEIKNLRNKSTPPGRHDERSGDLAD
jgi:hypothetical protein